jgi:hypothetical protein
MSLAETDRSCPGSLPSRSHEDAGMQLSLSARSKVGFAKTSAACVFRCRGAWRCRRNLLCSSPYRVPVVAQVGSPETTIALAQFAQRMTTPANVSAVDTGG